jgi:PHD/YefM family antitoxin component YafN of YafNO toxin-antitoxin module
MATEVIPSTEARNRLPQLIEELVAHPGETIEVGRQRKREVVVLAAARYDELMEQITVLRDLAWAAFAQERVEHPTSEPVSWDEAQRRRRQAAAS